MINGEVSGTAVEGGAGDDGNRHNDRCMIILYLGLGFSASYLHFSLHIRDNGIAICRRLETEALNEMRSEHGYFESNKDRAGAPSTAFRSTRGYSVGG